MAALPHRSPGCAGFSNGLLELDVLPALRAGDHRAGRDREDVDQLMIAPARLTWVGEPGEARRQTFDHVGRRLPWRTEDDGTTLDQRSTPLMREPCLRIVPRNYSLVRDTP